MRASTLFAASIALLFIGSSPLALADRDKDESGHGHKRHGGREFKEEYWEGNCKVERKLEKNGDYKEERKCKGGHREHAHAHPVVVQPVTVIYPPWVVVEQGRPHHYRQGYEPAPVVQEPVSHCNSETVGKVLGGLGGAVLGHQVGKGGGRALATVGGAVAGLLIGGELGRRMDASNQACIGQTLEAAPAGRRVQWNSGPAEYAVVPGAVVNRNGTYCRPYEAQVMTPAGWQVTHGTACRRPDGVWVQTS